MAKDVLDRQDWDGLQHAVQLANDYIHQQEEWMVEAYFEAKTADDSLGKLEFVRYVYDRTGLLSLESWKGRLYQGLRRREGKPTNRLESGVTKQDPERNASTFCRQVAKFRRDFENLIQDDFDPDGAWPHLAVFEDWDDELQRALDEMYVITGLLKRKLRAAKEKAEKPAIA